MKLHVSLPGDGYDVYIWRGGLEEAGVLFDLDRRTLILTDDGVPAVYAESLAEKCKAPFLVTIPQGEDSKSLAQYGKLLSFLLQNGFTRGDCVVAVGGGVVGDLAGFTAASYMRGIDFYNVPTTVLSQVDSSIGGKTAINLDGVKNVVGAFYQPKAVLIDPEVLHSLPPRQVANGLAESIKMAVTHDPDLFRLFEHGSVASQMDEVLCRSLQIKKKVVELDATEKGLRRVLNFGHTIGHGLEAASGGRLFHGECVALGMLPLCSETVRARIIPVLKQYGLPVNASFDPETVMQAIMHDKKSEADGVQIVYAMDVGAYAFRFMTYREIRSLLSIIREETA